MKVYQIQETRADIDDVFRNVLETYSSKALAELRLQQFEARIAVLSKKVEFCRDCPVCSIDFDKYPTVGIQKREAETRCSEAEIRIANGDCFCDNNNFWDKYEAATTYKILEVDVLDSIP